MQRPGIVDNIILVTIDGVRTQEFFQGIDVNLLSTREDGESILESVGGTCDSERRQSVWPWFWGHFLPNDGVAVGNRHHPTNPMSTTVSNMHRFSYPGYNEIFTGKAEDEKIDSNAAIQNPFKTVFEFIKEQLHLVPAQVAAFASWAPIAKAAEYKMRSIITNAGPNENYDPFDCDYANHTMSEGDRTKVKLINELQFKTTAPFADMRYDSFTTEMALIHLKTYKPRVLYVGLGETDEWAHHNDYRLYLQTIRLADDFLKDLWTYAIEKLRLKSSGEWMKLMFAFLCLLRFVQSDPQYKDRTALIVTTDHGRGDSPPDWIAHSSSNPGSEFVCGLLAGAFPALIFEETSQTHPPNTLQTLFLRRSRPQLLRCLDSIGKVKRQTPQTP